MESLVLIALTVLCGWLYFLPAIIGFKRRHPNRWPILVIDLAFGATGIGWLGALIWALQIVHLPSGDASSQSTFSVFVSDLRSARVSGAQAEQHVPSFDMDAAVGLLERLKQLRTDAQLTDEEYQTMRAALISRLS